MTTWTVARQAPLSMGFSRQEYWSGSPSPTPSLLNSLETITPEALGNAHEKGIYVELKQKRESDSECLALL